MVSSPRHPHVRTRLAWAAAAAVLAGTASGGWLPTGAGPYAYTNADLWDGGTIDGLFPTSLVLAANQTILFPASWTSGVSGLSFRHSDVGGFSGGVTLGAASTTGTLTLAGDFAWQPADNRALEVLRTLNLDLGGDARTFHAGSATGHAYAYFAGDLRNGALMKDGCGKMIVTSPTTLDRPVTVRQGVLTIANSGSATGVPAFAVAPGATLAVSSQYGAGSNRLGDAASVSLDSAFLNLVGLTAGNAFDEERLGTIVLAQGASVVSVFRGSESSTSILHAAAIVRVSNAVACVRGGLTLGLTPDEEGIGFPGSRLFLDSAPPLAGGGGAPGSTTLSVVPWLVGDRHYNSASAGRGWLTYEDGSGLRLLASNEYATSVMAADQVSGRENVRLTANETVTANRSVNSLITTDVRLTVNPGVTVAIRSGLVLLNGYGGLFGSGRLDFGDAEGLVLCDVGSWQAVAPALAGRGGVTFARTEDESLWISLWGACLYTGPTTVLRGGLQPNADDRLSFYSPVILHSRGWLDLKMGDSAAATRQTIAGLGGAGTLTNRSASIGTLLINTDDGYRFTGNTGGPISIVKSGAGTQSFDGLCLHSGMTDIRNGAVLVNGTFGPVSFGGGVFVRKEGLLGGTGDVWRAVTVAPQGTLAPGSPAGEGALTVHGDVTLHEGAQFRFTCAPRPSAALRVQGRFSAPAQARVTVRGLAAARALPPLVLVEAESLAGSADVRGWQIVGAPGYRAWAATPRIWLAPMTGAILAIR